MNKFSLSHKAKASKTPRFFAVFLFLGTFITPTPAHMKRSTGFLLLITLSFLSFGQPIVTLHRPEADRPIGQTLAASEKSANFPWADFSELGPDKVYGKLFVDVQMNRVFADGKTFVDCIPKRKPADIVADYETLKGVAGFDLKKFVLDNFDLPPAPNDTYKTNTSEDVVTHIRNLWTVLKRTPDKPVEGSSLLPLPYPYIVPGGRFREVYYWDSYFTMLGLKESHEIGIIDDMVKNFAFLIENYGHIPNGNRTYYLGRSQPPFFSVMVELLAEVKGDSIYQYFLPAMEKEYAFWMDGADKLKRGQAYRRVVRLPGGDVLNRYWDDATVPRQESWREDVLTAQRSGRDKVEMYQHLRAAAESGIDFSSRWFADEKNLTTI